MVAIINDIVNRLTSEHRSLTTLLASVTILASYHLIFFRYFPTEQGGLGHDFSLFIPRLMDGYLWFRNNGAGAVPWFTPSFCGGVPAFPDPQNVYYTLPQALTLLLPPTQAVYLTIVLMTIAGYVGSLFLLKRTFVVSTNAAIVGATLFLFNGFFIYRMMVGAIVFHSYMLLPWALMLVLKPASSTENTVPRERFIINGLLVALIGSYFVYSGMVNALLPLLMSGLIIALGIAIVRTCNPLQVKTILVAFSVFLMITASKFNASLAYLSHFPRSFYPLPGVDDIGTLIYLVLRSLFLPPTDTGFSEKFSNLEWVLDRHEFEYGLTFVPLLILVLYAFRNRKSISRQFHLGKMAPATWVMAISLLLLCLAPVLLNYYQPGWNALLKQVPVIKNSSALIRFILVYIMPLVVLSAILLDRMQLNKSGKLLLSSVLVVLVILTNAITDRSSYIQSANYGAQTFDIMHGKMSVLDGRNRIRFIGNIENTSAFSFPTQISADFLFGISRKDCYEPLFGYRREALPWKTLHSGPVTDVDNEYLNIKNPACYVFPKENGCEPGDHFSVQEKDQADRFLSYNTFDFSVSGRQKVLNKVSIFALLASLLSIAVALLTGLVTRINKRSGTT